MKEVIIIKRKLMYILALIVMVIVTNNNLNAASPIERWTKQYGSTSADYLNSIQQTNDGGYIAVGRTQGSVGGNTNLGGYDGWIIKIDSNGNEQWSKQYGGILNDFLESIQQTNDGGYIAVGRTQGSVGGNTNLGGYDGWIIKIDSNGNEQWSKQYGGMLNDFLESVQQTNDGSYISAGQTQSSVGGNTNLGGYDGWIIKLNSDGSEQWSKQYGSISADYLNSIQQTSDGSYIAAGYTSGSVGGNTNLGDYDGWIIRIYSDGSEQWSKQYGSNSTDYLNSIQQTSDGSYIAAGFTLGNVGGNTNLGINDGWIIKINSDGSEQWSNQYGGTSDDRLEHIKKTSNGGYIAAGYTLGSVGEGNNLGKSDGWIIKINSSGSEEWSKQYGGSGTDYLFSVQQTSDDGYIAAGYTDDNVGGNTNLGGYNGWIIKLQSQYELNFDLNGGSGTAPITQIIFVGDLAINPIVPVRSGYTFSGWNTNTQGSGTTWNFTTSTMPANNVTLYAQWKKNVEPTNYYILSFNLNGGSSRKINSQKLKKGDIATKPNNPTKEGNTFNGWNTNADGSGIVWNFTSSKMPANDVTLYAQWKKNDIEKNIPSTGSNMLVIATEGLVLIIILSMVYIKKYHR